MSVRTITIEAAGTISIEASGLRFTADAAGPEDGPLVLCLHGFPDTRRTFRHLLPELAAAGYRAVAPTLRGYEPSTLSAAGLPLPSDLATLAGDAFAQAEALGAARFHLIGHDWGAAVGYAAAALAPHHLFTLTTLAVPPLTHLDRMLRRHPLALRRLAYMLFFQLPALPERALLAKDGALLRTLWRRWSPTFVPTPDDEAHLDAVVAALRLPGVARAALAYYRALRPPRSLPALRLLRRPLPDSLPALCLAGADDGCLDPRLLDPDLAPASPNLHVEILPACGHFLHLERPADVARLVLDQLRALPSPLR